MIARDIRAFVDRDWAAVRRAKDAYWAERISRLGAAEGLRIADELRRQALLRNPDWPDAGSRRDDLASHTRLAELLRRVGPSGCR